MRQLLLTVVLAGVLHPGAAAQQQPPSLQFEVASIKPWSPPATPFTRIAMPAVPPGSGIFKRTTTVAGLIAYAYEVPDFQIGGGQDWVRSVRYDVAARAGREASAAELREMVKTLLADRFTLRVRTETRELTLLELRRARSDGRVGPNLHDCSNPNDKQGISTPEKPFRAPSNGSVATADCSDGVEVLARIATRQLQAMVVDKTGLTGQWRFDVYYSSDNPNLPTFEGALREQLGLRLERARGPAPFVVIESVDRPTPN